MKSSEQICQIECGVQTVQSSPRLKSYRKKHKVPSSSACRGQLSSALCVCFCALYGGAYVLGV